MGIADGRGFGEGFAILIYNELEAPRARQSVAVLVDLGEVYSRVDVQDGDRDAPIARSPHQIERH
jgi:hypothetical protein